MNTKTLRIAPGLLVQFLQEPSYGALTAAGLPSDAVVVGAAFNHHCIELEIASATFGAEGGLLDVTFTRCYVCQPCPHLPEKQNRS